MADRFADAARAFLLAYPRPLICAHPLDADRVLYSFLAEQYPSYDLTPEMLARVTWSIHMLRDRS